MSIRDFCEQYRVGRTKCNEEIQKGQLKARKLGSRTLIGSDDAEEWWLALPVVREVAGKTIPETLSTPGPRIIEHSPSLAIGDVVTTPAKEEMPSIGKGQLSPKKKHAVATRTGRP